MPFLGHKPSFSRLSFLVRQDADFSYLKKRHIFKHLFDLDRSEAQLYVGRKIMKLLQKLTDL